MQFNFPERLDLLITEAKEAGVEVGEMAADLRGAAEGLDAEGEDED